MRTLWVLSALTALFACAGCAPSTQEAERALRESIESQSGGKITLLSFMKTDGQKFEVAGVSCYKLTFEAVIQCERTGSWLAGPMMAPLEFRFTEAQPQQGTMAGFYQSAIEGGRGVTKGQRFVVNGTMIGEKSEKGWTYKTSESRIESEAPRAERTEPKGFYEQLQVQNEEFKKKSEQDVAEREKAKARLGK